MEYWDIYDSRRRKTGKTVQRGTPLLPGEYHLVVHICLFGSDGRMLIQRRQPFKAGFPGLWDLSATGSAVAGEDSAQAAQRELSEELGVRIDFADIRPYITFYREYGFVDVYVLTADPGVLCLQEEEVIEARFATEEEICALIDAGDFVPFERAYISLLFSMCRRGNATVTVAQTPGILYCDEGDVLTVTGFSGSDKTVVIPSFFDGKPVRTIGEGAFAGCTDLCGVFLPHGLQVIGKRAFAGCTGLRSLILPGTLEHIGESAFSGCCALTEFRYAAVVARWETVRKESGWDEGLPMYLLVCRDRSIGK